MTLKQALRESSAGGYGAAVPPGAVQQTDAAYQSGIAALLDADLLFEFRLRDSSVAQQLRSSPLEFNESEFRQVFRVLDEMQNSGGGIDAVLAARERLRDVLGNSRLAQFWAARDPVLTRLQGTAERLGISGASMLSIYEILNEFQDRKMQVAKLAEVDPGSVTEQSAALRDAERAAIAAVVGAELADEILRARAIETLQIFGGSRDSGSQ
jgi:hypothetical protein